MVLTRLNLQNLLVPNMFSIQQFLSPTAGWLPVFCPIRGQTLLRSHVFHISHQSLKFQDVSRWLPFIWASQTNSCHEMFPIFMTHELYATSSVQTILKWSNVTESEKENVYISESQSRRRRELNVLALASAKYKMCISLALASAIFECA